jgi:hypothetical protein
MADLAIRLHRPDVLRSLGYPRAAGPAAHVEKRLSELWEMAVALLSPRGSWRIIRGTQAANVGMKNPSENVGIGLVTIGAALEEEVRKRGEEDRPLDALILDAIGSVAAESAADALNSELCGEARRRGLHAAPRVSPGYGYWDLNHQAGLLALLPTEELEVHLTSGMMMVPRKSVSFALNFVMVAPSGRDPASKCARCGLASCLYRERLP